MAPHAEKKYELICVVVPFGVGSKVLRAAKDHGVTGGTVLLGRGTVKSPLLDLLGLTDVRKEIVLMIAESGVAEEALRGLDRQFSFAKPHHGIAFSTDVIGLFGMRDCPTYKSHGSTGGEDMYKGIFVVVDRGKAQEVIDAASAAGSRGATVINARHSRTESFVFHARRARERNRNDLGPGVPHRTNNRRHQGSPQDRRARHGHNVHPRPKQDLRASLVPPMSQGSRPSLWNSSPESERKGGLLCSKTWLKPGTLRFSFPAGAARKLSPGTWTILRRT